MGRYKVIRELGRNQEGGRITYLATDTSLDPPQQVVIKEFRFAALGANWSGFKAYEREIEILRGLNHPRIPRYLDSFETKTGFCLVQEYKNALSLVVRRSFTPEEIKKIAVSVLEILVYLQKRIPPVIHRDIKPENIVVDKELNAYLVDFGFARIRSGELALSSVAAGTPGFMPPEEQFGRPLTEASDLYSLGATLICLLTGTRSLDVGNLIDDDYRFDFKGKVPQLSPSFIAWLEKMVVPNVKQRYTNAAVALEALKPIRVVGSATWQEILGYAVKRRTSVSVVGLAILAIFALLGMNLIVSRSEKTEKIATPQLIESPRSALQQLLETNQCVECNLQKANLVDAKLEGANIQGAILAEANLEGANLQNANLVGAVLSDANLEGANLVRANLNSAGLNSAKLGGAILNAANLAGTQMANANLNSAKVSEANLRGAKLEGAKLELAKLKGAIMPDGTKHP